MSRGLQNCNPGNIRQSKVRYKGEVRPSRDSAFKQFESLAWGYRCLLYTSAGVISVFMIVVVEMSVRVPPEAANGKFRKARRTGLILCFVCCIS